MVFFGAKRAACAPTKQDGETLYVENPRTDKSFNYAFDNGIPLILILGEQEIANGIYKIKSLNENKEYEIKFDELVSKVQELSAANPYLLPKDSDGQIIQNANLGQIKPKQAAAP